MAVVPQVVIEDALLAKILRNPAITTHFPFMKTAAAKHGTKKACGGCARKNRARQMDFDGLKRSIAHMPNSDKAKLKGLLNAQQVVVVYRNSKAGKTKLKF